MSKLVHVMKKKKKKSSKISNTVCFVKSVPLKLIDILKIKEGFELFQRFCENNYCVEHLLFLIEVAAYKKRINCRNGEKCKYNNNNSDPILLEIESIHISSDLETMISSMLLLNSNYNSFSHIIQSLQYPISNSQQQQHIFEEEFAESESESESESVIDWNSNNINFIYNASKDIFHRYIITSSQFSINIPSEIRQNLITFFRYNQQILHEINNIIKYLYNIYDIAFSEIYYLLKDGSFCRFIETDDYKYLTKKYIN